MKSFKNSKKNLKVHKLRSKKLVRKNKKSSIKYGGVIPTNNLYGTPLTTAPSRYMVMEKQPEQVYADLGEVAPVVNRSLKPPDVKRSLKPIKKPTPPLAGRWVNYKNSSKKP